MQMVAGLARARQTPMTDGISSKIIVTGAAVIFSATLLCASTLLASGWHQRSNVLSQRAISLRDEVATQSATAQPAPIDFVSHLPTSVNAEAILRDAHGWANPSTSPNSQLQLIMARAQSIPPSAAQLSRADLNFQARGRYPAVKDWLRELLARYPSTALLGLEMRREASDETVQATLRMRLYGQALSHGKINPPIAAAPAIATAP